MRLPLILAISSAAFVHSMSRSPAKISNSLSRGASALKNLVLQTAENDQTLSLDLSDGIAWLEHINLVVGNANQAEIFYQQFLGLTRDPDAKFHVNLGQQQFHLAENGDPAQVIAGSIGIVVPNLITLRKRLEESQKALEGTMFQIVEDVSDHLTLKCPWGNCFHIYDLQSEKERKPKSESIHKMVNLHSEGGRYAPRMAVRGQPGIRFVEFAIPVGTAAKVAEFYRTVIGCSAVTALDGSALISSGPGVHLVFTENKEIAESDMNLMEGVHICVYAHRFKELYSRLDREGLIWTNPRFTHLDSCDTWEEAEASRTLRFRYIVDTGTGDKLYELEHETRPLRHGQYLKVPRYEPR